ncbi:MULTISPECIES: IclR family transcriptional regulator domain-containing protein [Streptomyces]|uniref:IclR family transcriptional regulator domain-containing protein n=1 Tax=Streptomyces TaxID=1883 RepID=UPI001E3B3235|nr:MULTISPECIES: IclR family transcriptional regulator C-terminal domain-containing protein [Streptomyces]UFQ16085.1 helix-turn-helix domain-containing protein [Streptomyces huasconensis]WCL85689.1 IclR family transcriptional regulator C-terminal domain-containing protein [Streptomyces sp. JCM 35825]
MPEESVRPLERGLAVLRALAGVEPGQLRAGDLVRATGLARSTVDRVVTTLARLGYVRLRGQQLHLTPRLMELGNAYLAASGLTGEVAARTARLADELDESVSLAVPDGDGVRFVTQAARRRAMSVAFRIGDLLPPERCAPGALFAAAWDAERWAAWRERVATGSAQETYPALPPGPAPAGAPDLAERAAHARRSGWALDDQLIEPGLIAVAVPVRGTTGRVRYALSAVSHTSRHTAQGLAEAVLPRLHAEAEHLAALSETEPRPTADGRPSALDVGTGRASAQEAAHSRAPAHEVGVDRAPAQEATDGRASAQEAADSRAPAQEVGVDRAPAHEATDGRASAQEAADSQAPAPEAAVGRAPAPEAADSRAPAQKATDGRAPALEAVGGQAPTPEATDPATAKHELGPGFLQSLARGLAVLRALGGARGGGLPLTVLAEATGLPRATARRCLRTLEAAGYAAHDGRLFRPLPRILELGHAALSGLTFAELAEPHLRDLADRVRQSASATVLDGTDIRYVARAATVRVMSVHITVGTRFPAYATAMGRVLLAGLPEEERERLLKAAPPRALTPRTVTDPDELARVLDRAAAEGHAAVDQELEDGLRSVAVPVRDAAGRVVAAVNVAQHAGTAPLSRTRDALLPALRATAAAIETDLHVAARFNTMRMS